MTNLRACSLFSLCTALAVAPAPAAAQGRVWVVDQQRGPGSHYSDTPAAIQAAADGDLILVRAGLYSLITIDNKALTLVGSPGAQVTFYVVVQNLAATKSCVVSGIEVRPSFNLRINRCAGRVLLDRVIGAGLLIDDSPNVQLNGCSLPGRAFGTPTVTVTRSTVAATNLVITGGAASLLLRGEASPAIGVVDSNVSLARSVLTGGNGEASPTLTYPDQAAITFGGNSTLILSGDASAAIRSGRSGLGTVGAIETTGGAILLDPNVTLNGTNAAPIRGPATVTSTWLPSLIATGHAPGAAVQADLFSPAGDVVVFLTGVLSGHLAVGSGEGFWLDPALFLVTGVALQGTSQHVAHTIPLPNDPNLTFGAWTLQAVSGTPGGGFKLSNPASYNLGN